SQNRADWRRRRSRLIDDVELRGRHTAAQDTGRPNLVTRHSQRAQRLPEILEWQAGIQTGPEDHVARNPRTAIQAEHPRHYSRPDSLKLQYRTSPITRWSTIGIPINTPAAARRRVNSSSSLLGVGSPDG